jgi:hypothetical protein
MHRIFVLTGGLFLAAACAAVGPANTDRGDEGSSDGGADQDDLDSPGSSGGGSEKACATVVVEAEPKILDMIVLLDRSLSMSSLSKWDGATDALSSFFNDPTSAGINASLVFFPNPGELTSNGAQCDVSKYDPTVSPHVAFGGLPSHASVLDYAMDAQMPAGFTPTQHALQGVVPFATQRRLDNPDHEVIIVVATDGLPAGCSGVTNDTIYAEAAAAAAEGVSLYAIAFDGAKVEWVDDLAQAGGTTLGIDVTNDITQFQDAMDAIRDANLGCSFSIPDPSQTAFDKDKVNVTIEHIGAEIELTKVGSAEECSGDTSWYYDSEDNPTSIHLCDGTCAEFGTSEEAAISIVFGCSTKLY